MCVRHLLGHSHFVRLWGSAMNERVWSVSEVLSRVLDQGMKGHWVEFRHAVKYTLHSDAYCHTPIPRLSKTLISPSFSQWAMSHPLSFVLLYISFFQPPWCSMAIFFSALLLYWDVVWRCGSRRGQQPFRKAAGQPSACCQVLHSVSLSKQMQW